MWVALAIGLVGAVYDRSLRKEHLAATPAQGHYSLAMTSSPDRSKTVKRKVL